MAANQHAANRDGPHRLMETSIIHAVEMSQAPAQSDAIMGQMNKHTTSILHHNEQ